MMENPRDKARASWVDAQKIRADIMGKISSSKKERGTTNMTSRFEEVEQTMAEFRLACMNVIAHDFEYAAGKNVEPFLWHAHIFLNGEYRKVMSRLMSQNQVVVRRKLEKQYRAFLRTSQSFYRVYIQQLSGRFYIPELHHAARGTDIEPTEKPAPDSKPPSELGALILKSCQITLVHLGDLVRYRCQMSDKSSNSNVNFEKALEYYGLANTIDPDDGSAHHQLAVLYQLQNRHLDIVYHFHRSVCIAKPHELGIANLERAFKGLDNAPAARNGTAKDPCQTMITWFLRLHAYYFQGEPFSAQSELEKEVLHRIEMAMKSDTDEAILRKMIFINISAYDVALEKVKASWTIQGSQSAQFLLRFNIQTILVLLRLLKLGLLDDFAIPVYEGNDMDDDECPLQFSQTLLKLLPLFRLYISWICVCSADIHSYRDYLEPSVSDVYRTLAEVLTLLGELTDKAVTVTPSKYLLVEDTEALGLRPFRNQNLPLFVQTKAFPDLESQENPKARKPRQRAFGRQYQPHIEAVWRMRDIIYCGILLARSSSYPLALSLNRQNREDTETECWTFTEEASQQISLDERSMTHMLKKLGLGDTDAASQNPAVRGSDSTRSALSSIESPLSDNNGDGMSFGSPQQDKGKSIEEQAPSSLLDTDLSGDSEMVNMVNKLLDPIGTSRPQSSQAQADTIYGMNTATANEIFGPFAAGSAQGSAQPSPASRTIPNLPWDYFYAPTPNRSDSRGNNQLASNGDYVPRSAHRQPDGYIPPSYLPSELEASLPQDQVSLHAGGATTYTSPRLSQGGSVHHSHQSKDSRDSLEVSRSAVLDTLTSALFAQHGLAPNKAQQSDAFTGGMSAGSFRPPGSTPGISRSPYLTGNSSPYLNSIGNNLGPGYMERSAGQRNVSGPGPIGQGKPTRKPNGSQDARNYSQNSPNSSEFGFPPPAGQRPSPTFAPGPFQQQHSPWAPDPIRSSSSFGFSHPSSLDGGTPFGRLGAVQNNREDYTHFRNQLQGAISIGTPSYNRQASESALLKDDKKQRPK